MIVTYFRSSSYSKWDMCPHSYFLSYVLGRREPSGKKAILGNIVHKALEGLARKKLAMQNGHDRFYDDELQKWFVVDEFDPELAIKDAYNHYSKKETHHEWFPRDLKQTTGWMYDALTKWNGAVNPMSRDVIMPEQYFDIPIECDWARYSYTLDGGAKVEGNLRIKGTVDLITRINDETIEYLDWKTGMRKDWASGEIKDYKKLKDDPQLRLYHYALTRLYPQYKYIIMNIVFIQDGGPFAIPFGPDDLKKTEKMLKERFETIRGCHRPPRIIKDKKHSWKCKRLCHYGKTNHFDEQGNDTGRTVCEHIHTEILTLGMDRVVAKYGDKNAFSSYGDGGGQSNRDEKVASVE